MIRNCSLSSAAVLNNSEMFSSKTLTPPAQGGRTSVQLVSSSNSYLVEQLVGQGTFGTVAKCKRSSDMKTVAIKMTKDKDDNRHQTRAEAKSLQRLSTLDSDKSNIVKWHGAFVDRGYFCLEFESLDRSLHDFIAQRNFEPLPLKEIRPIVQQITNALCHLKELNIIHADLKLQNVMLVNHARQPFKIKVIDFGLACDSSSARVGSCIQTLPYRSPEVILGLPFTEAVDMWSVGCIAAYLYLGSLLYAGHSEYDIMRCIIETQGQLPNSLLSQGQKTSSFFNKVGKPPNKWKFKSPEEVLKSTGKPSVDIRAYKFKSLEEILFAREISSQNRMDRVAETVDLNKFIELLKGMLHQEESRRFKPHVALNHPFFRMGHLRCKFSYTSYFKSSTKIMAVCNFTPAVNAKATKPSQNPPAVGECPQQSLPGPAYPVLQCPSASLPSAFPNKRDQQHIPPHPCTVIQSTSNIKSGIKRKADDRDLNLAETPRQFKFAKHEHRVQSCEETVAVCRNNTSASIYAGVCPQQPRSASVYPVPQYLPAVVGFQQKPQSGTTIPVQQYWPAVTGCQQQPLYGPTSPVLQYRPAVRGCPQQPLYGPTSPVLQYRPAVRWWPQQPLYGPTSPVQQYWPAVRGCPQQPLYGPTSPVQQYRPAVRGCPQQPLYGPTSPVQQHWPAVRGCPQQPLYGPTTPVQQYQPAVRGCPQQPLYGPTTPVQHYQPAVRRCPQQPLYGPTSPVQQYQPAVRGRPQQPLYGPTSPVQQYQPAVSGCPQQPLYGPTGPVQQYQPAVRGCPQQPLYGPTVPVQPNPSSSLPSAVAYNLDQQHINPQPHIGGSNFLAQHRVAQPAQW